MEKGGLYRVILSDDDESRTRRGDGRKKARSGRAVRGERAGLYPAEPLGHEAGEAEGGGEDHAEQYPHIDLDSRDISSLAPCFPVSMRDRLPVSLPTSPAKSSSVHFTAFRRRLISSPTFIFALSGRFCVPRKSKSAESA